MEIDLHYAGPLPSSGNPRASKPGKRSPKLPIIWRIRNLLAPQIWNVLQHHPSVNGRGGTSARAAAHQIRVPIVRGGRNFVSVLRPGLGLVCRLNIRMLVNHDLGSIVAQAGDLDNRFKTLLDALRIPKDQEVTSEMDSAFDPYPCLLDDDASVIALILETARLYDVPATAAENEVRLEIKAQIITHIPNFYSDAFGII